MKKTTKSMLTTALILVAAGLILTVGSFIFCIAGGVDIYGDAERKFDFRTFSLDMPALRAETGAAQKTISGISISAQVGDIEVRPTDGETHFEFYNVDRENLHCSYDTGVLTIAEENEVTYFGLSVNNEGFSFRGLRYLFSANNFSGARRIVLFWNQSEAMPPLYVKTVVGNLKINGIRCSANLTAEVTTGGIVVNNCSSPSGTLRANTSVGTVSVRQNEFALTSLYTTCGSLHAGVLGQKTVLESVLGSATVELLLPEDQYNIRCTTSLGYVYPPDGASVGSEYTSSLTEGQNSITATAIVGSVRVKNAYAENEIENTNGVLVGSVPVSPENE